MKLSQITPVFESLIPIEIYMILKEVINAGKLTNTAQTQLIANLVHFFKYRPAVAIHELREHPPTEETLNAVKNLNQSELLELVQWLYASLYAGEPFASLSKDEEQMEVLDWIKYVLRKQD